MKNTDDYLAAQVQNYFAEDQNVYTEYTLEIWDETSYIVYEEEITEEELIMLLIENDIDINNIDREHINICNCNGLNVQITPYSEVQDPKDI